MSESPEHPPNPVPRRELRDPKTLRALAHPVRLRLFDELVAIGSATATELAERIGESPANCSWHLRQLAQHGFVEEAGGGTGRQRPWRVVVQSTSIAKPDDAEPEFTAAHDTLIEVLMGREVEAWRDWRASEKQEPPDWQQASLGVQANGIWLTAEELAAFKKELRELVEQHILTHLDRMEPANRPAGSRPIKFVAWAFPSGPPHPQGDPAHD